MGIIDFVKSGVQEMMVARPDNMKHLIVYKHPDGNIPTYSRLTVDLDECAVFFKSGSPPTVGALPPRRYPLSTENIPDRKSTRLNSSHLVISYAVFCLKKKKKTTIQQTTRRNLGRVRLCSVCPHV